MSVGQMSLIERFESIFDNLTAWKQILKVQPQTYIEQIAQVPLPSIEMMAKLTADDLELRLAKNTEIDSFML